MEDFLSSFSKKTTRRIYQRGLELFVEWYQRDIDTILAEMQYHGLRKSVAEEYIEVLKDLGKVKFEEGEIIWNGAEEDKDTQQEAVKE